MPLFSGNKERGNNNRKDNNNNSQHVDTSDCEYCANGMQCPYWYQDSDGNWWHDKSGAQGYVDNTVINDTYNVWEDLPKTPDPDLNPKKGKSKPKDDNEGPGRFKLF